MAHRLALATREVHRPLAVRLLALHWLLGSGMFKIWCLVSPIGFTLSCLFMPLYDGVAHRLPYHHINRGPSTWCALWSVVSYGLLMVALCIFRLIFWREYLRLQRQVWVFCDLLFWIRLALCFFRLIFCFRFHHFRCNMSSIWGIWLYEKYFKQLYSWIPKVPWYCHSTSISVQFICLMSQIVLILDIQNLWKLLIL